MKNKSSKKKLLSVGIVFLIMVACCACKSQNNSTTISSDNEDAVTTEKITEMASTTESKKQKKKKLKDKNDLSGYYGKSVHEIEKIIGYELEKDGDTYYSGAYFIGVDEDENVTSITMIFNPITEESTTFEGINMQDSIEDASKKLEANGYTLEEEDSSSKIYRDEGDMIVSINAVSEEEYILDYMSDELYIARKEEYENYAVDSEGYYITDTATGDTIETHVYYAYTQNMYDNNVINVVCKITNISNDSIVFDAGDYYELDNNGLIANVNTTDYDYREISSGYSFKATLSFTCPGNSNKDLSCMNMTADGLNFNLGDKPQSENEKKEFYGIYNRPLSKIIILDNYDDTYTVYKITKIGDEVYRDNYKNVTLDENNIFFMNNGSYLWSPDECTIYPYDSTWEEIDETQNPWVKD